MSDTEFPVFDGSGKMLGNLTSIQGVPPVQAVPTLPAIGGSAAQGASAITQAASNAGITGGSIPPAATTGTPAAATGASSSTAQNWFARGAIVVLGFVFVAVGLSQFGVVQKIKP